MNLFGLRKLYNIDMCSDLHSDSEIASRTVGLTALEMSALLDAKEREIIRLRRRVAWFQRQIFGQRSERRMPEPAGVQGTLGEAFDVVPDDVAPARKTSIAAHERAPENKNGNPVNGNEDAALFFDASKVPVEVIAIANHEAAGLDPADVEVIGEQGSYRLAQRPGRYVSVEYVRPVIKLRADFTPSCPPAPVGVRDYPSRAAKHVEAALGLSAAERRRIAERRLRRLRAVRESDRDHACAVLGTRTPQDLRFQGYRAGASRSGTARDRLIVQGRAADPRRWPGWTSKLARRQEQSKPVLERLFAWIDEQFDKQGLLPSGPFLATLAYIRERRVGLSVYLDDPEVSIDTNRLERALRVIPMGKKNWLFSWTKLGARHVGVVQSLLVTCRLHDTNPYDYFVDVLQRVGQHPTSLVHQLTPRNWRDLFAENPLRSSLHDLGGRRT